MYIGETRRRLGTRLKEHRDACKKGLTDKSAIAEHAWTNGHPIRWDATKVLQRASRTIELVMKESLSRRLGTRLKEHRDACKKGLTDKSAIAEHAWTNDHPIRWDATKVLQRASRTMELVMKESLSHR